MVARAGIKLDEMSRRGPVAIWGAGAKGVTLANLLDPLRERIACVVDLNPAKQGRFLPGTGHPIIGPHELEEFEVRTALVMNANYAQEIEALLRERDLRIELVDPSQWLEADSLAAAGVGQ